MRPNHERSAPRIEVAASAVAVVDSHLLLVRRSAGSERAGSWAVPGGRVEAGETVREAVVRELREETGLRAECGEFVGWVERVGEGFHYLILDFVVALLDPPERAVAGDDADAVAWVPLGQVLAWPLVDGLGAFLVEHGVVPPLPAPPPARSD